MNRLIDQLAAITPTALTGSLVRTEGMVAAVAGFPAPVGALVEIERQSGAAVPAEVIGFREGSTLVYPLGDMSGIRHGSRVRLVRTSRYLSVGNSLLGRIINAHGQTVDGRATPATAERVPLDHRPPPAIDRPRID